jgi:GxxExxY protein
MSQELIHKDLSASIIGAAIAVLNGLKPGLDEKLYERALVIELRKRGHSIEQQREFPEFYDGQHIGGSLSAFMDEKHAVEDHDNSGLTGRLNSLGRVWF